MVIKVIEGLTGLATVGASLYSAHNAAKSGRAVERHSKEAQELTRRKAELNNNRSKQGMVYQAEAARADVTSQANMLGVAGSSSAQQVKGSISTQVCIEFSHMNSQQMLDDGILTANQAALDEQASNMEDSAKIMAYVSTFATVAQAASAMGLKGGSATAFTTAAASGGKAVYALAAANPAIAAALVVAAVLGEDEIKRIGKDLDSTIGVKAIKDAVDSRIQNVKSAGRKAEKAIKSVGRKIAKVFGW